MPQFFILFYANYTIQANQTGGYGTMPPLNTPLITFKHNSALTFSRFLRNCWEPASGVSKSDAIIRLINMPYGCVAEERCKPAESLSVFRY